MRRFLIVRFDVFQFHRLQGAGLALNFFFQTFNQFDLFDEDRVQLFHLMFEMREVGLQFLEALCIFVGHAGHGACTEE